MYQPESDANQNSSKQLRNNTRIGIQPHTPLAAGNNKFADYRPVQTDEQKADLT